MIRKYVHGYSPREQQRLVDQAQTLANLLHEGTYYPAGSRVLEAGCGIGAQTIILAQRSPEAEFTAIDISPESVAAAKDRVFRAGCTKVNVQTGDILHLPMAEASFDHVFLCFVLEHLLSPLAALVSLKALIRPGGTLTVIEGDHGSAYFFPESAEAMRTIACLVHIQKRLGGHPLIGRELQPLLSAAAFADVQVSPRVVYAHAGAPHLVEGFTRQTFIAMVEGVREAALDLGLMSAADWTRGIRDLNRTAEPGGTFCYTFFKGTAIK